MLVDGGLCPDVRVLRFVCWERLVVRVFGRFACVCVKKDIKGSCVCVKKDINIISTT